MTGDPHAGPLTRSARRRLARRRRRLRLAAGALAGGLAAAAAVVVALNAGGSPAQVRVDDATPDSQWSGTGSTGPRPSSGPRLTAEPSARASAGLAPSPADS
ncbi:hypothetical protein, partial [Marinitenerispora sediminis]